MNSKRVERASRKQIATMMSNALGEDITVKMVESNEQRWGIAHARILPDLNSRTVRFDMAKVKKALIRLGILSNVS